MGGVRPRAKELLVQKGPLPSIRGNPGFQIPLGPPSMQLRWSLGLKRQNEGGKSIGYMAKNLDLGRQHISTTDHFVGGGRKSHRPRNKEGAGWLLTGTASEHTEISQPQERKGGGKI